MERIVKFGKDARTDECPADAFGGVSVNVCINCIYHVDVDGFVVRCEYNVDEVNGFLAREIDDDDD